MRNVFYAVSILAFLAACSSSAVSVLSSWKNKEIVNETTPRYKKAYITALTGNQEAKQAIEKDLASAAKNKGIEVMVSSELFGKENAGEDTLNKEAVMKKIRDAGCDAIFAVTLVNQESDSRYVPGTVAYTPMQPYYGSYWGYQNFRYGNAVGYAGYYATDKTYFIEGNLYDSTSEKILWSSQSQTVNPSNIKSFSKKYSAAIISKMQSDGLLKKR